MSALRPFAGKMITSVTALAMAFGVMAASATPVRAQNTDAVKIIAGIAALAAVGAAINDKNDRDDRREAERRYNQRYNDRHDRDRRDRWDRDDRRHQYQPPRHARPGPPPHAKAHGWHKQQPQPPRYGQHNRPRPGEPRPRF